MIMDGYAELLLDTDKRRINDLELDWTFDVLIA